MVTQPMDGETVNDSLPEIKANLATLGNVDPKSVTMLISGVAHTAGGQRAKVISYRGSARPVNSNSSKTGFWKVCGKGLGSTHAPGERSGAWIKLRTNLEQESVIGGYIPWSRGFDALLVAVYEKKDLVFLAKV
jgi:ATP-dependent DNA ligase